MFFRASLLFSWSNHCLCSAKSDINPSRMNQTPISDSGYFITLPRAKGPKPLPPPRGRHRRARGTSIHEKVKTASGAVGSLSPELKVAESRPAATCPSPRLRRRRRRRSPEAASPRPRICDGAEQSSSEQSEQNTPMYLLRSYSCPAPVPASASIPCPCLVYISFFNIVMPPSIIQFSLPPSPLNYCQQPPCRS